MKKTKQPKPFFNALTKGTTLEMMLYDAIGEAYDGTGVSAMDVKAQMDNAAPFDKIVMRINSPGGDASEGIAIHNLLRAQNKPVQTIVDGIAASAASIVAMAGDQITMASNSLIMIHDAWTLCIGNKNELRKQADTLDIVDTAIAQTFVDRTKQPMDKIKQMMSDETWINAKDAIESGFATDIADSDDNDGEAMAMARTFKDLFKNMKHVPAVLKNEGDGCACGCSNCIAKDCDDCTNKDCDDPNCEDCPMQNCDTEDKTATPENSDLSLYEARLRLLKLNSV